MRVVISVFCFAALLTTFACKENPASTESAATSQALPPNHPATDGVNSIPLPPSGSIEGRIEVAPEVSDKVAPGDTIYLMARNAATGSLLAVARLEAPQTFPLSFRLSAENVMHPGVSLAGKVKLEARVDKDGDAMSKNPGDVYGAVDGLVAVPAKDVVVKLDSVL